MRSRTWSDEVASGFSTKTCLPASSAVPGELVVSSDSRRNDDRIDAVVSDDLVGREDAAGVGVAAGDRAESLRAHVAKRDELVFRKLGEIACEVRPPVAEPDHADADAVADAHQSVPLRRSMRSGVRRSRRRSRASDQPRA